MPRLEWDQVGERRFEAGVDRGVLYAAGRRGVAWNGLTGIDEKVDDIVLEDFHFEGVKFMTTRSSGDFTGTLKAYTYPDEFMEFDGLAVEDKGLILSNQPVRSTFDLSYRTGIGNDVDGFDAGYKIHLVYNVMATPSSRSYATLSDSSDPSELSWEISASPEFLPGARPTAHIILDTTQMNKYLVADIEMLLYGEDPDNTNMPLQDGLDGGTPSGAGSFSVDGTLSDGTLVDGGTPSTSESENGYSPSSQLPSLPDLVEMIRTWVLIEITDHGDGTWSLEAPDDFVTFTNPTTWTLRRANGEYLSETRYKLSTSSGF